MRTEVFFGVLLTCCLFTQQCFSEPVYEQYFNVSTSRGSYSSVSSLGNEWSFNHTAQGRARIYNWGNPHGGVLVLDDRVGNNTYSLNEAILTLNLSNWTNINLTFNHYDSDDEEHSIGSDKFQNNKNADGVAISSNGIDWFPIISFNQSNRTWQEYSSNISNFINDLSSDNQKLISTSGTFKIKFQQYDNYPHGSDGRKFDNIVVSGTFSPPPTVNSNSIVPEPASWSLFGIGLAAMYGFRRRQQGKAKA